MTASIDDSVAKMSDQLVKITDQVMTALNNISPQIKEDTLAAITNKGIVILVDDLVFLTIGLAILYVAWRLLCHPKFALNKHLKQRDDDLEIKSEWSDGYWNFILWCSIFLFIIGGVLSMFCIDAILCPDTWNQVLHPTGYLTFKIIH